MVVKIGGETQPKVKKAKAPKPAKASGPVTAQPPPRRKRRQRFLASYYPLVRKFPLEPIRDDAHLNQALAVVEALLRRDLDEGAGSYVDVLTGLVEEYESKAFPIPDASEADVLRELMRLNGLSQPAL